MMPSCPLTHSLGHPLLPSPNLSVFRFILGASDSGRHFDLGPAVCQKEASLPPSLPPSLDRHLNGPII